MPGSPAHINVLKAIREAEDDSRKILKDAERRIVNRFGRLRAFVEASVGFRSNQEPGSDIGCSASISSSEGSDSDDDSDHRPRHHRNQQKRLSTPPISPADAPGFAPAPVPYNSRQVFFPPQPHPSAKANQCPVPDRSPSPPYALATYNTPVKQPATVPSTLGQPDFPHAFSPHQFSGPSEDRFYQDERTYVEFSPARQTNTPSDESYGPGTLVEPSIDEVEWTPTTTSQTSQQQTFDAYGRSGNTSDVTGSEPSAVGPSVSHLDVPGRNGSPDWLEKGCTPYSGVYRGGPQEHVPQQVDDGYPYTQHSFNPDYPQTPNPFTAGPYDRYPSEPPADMSPSSAGAAFGDGTIVQATPSSQVLSYATPSPPLPPLPQGNVVPTPVSPPQVANSSNPVSPVAGKKRSRSDTEDEGEPSNYRFGEPSMLLSEPTGERPAQRLRTSDEPALESLHATQQQSAGTESPASQSLSRVPTTSLRSPYEHPQRELMLAAPGHPPRAYHPALPSPPLAVVQDPRTLLATLAPASALALALALPRAVRRSERIRKGNPGRK